MSAPSRPALWLLLGLAVGLVLGMIVGYVTPALGVTEATLNVRVSDSTSEVSQDVGSAMRRSSVVRLQEVWEPHVVAGIVRALRQHPRWRMTSRTVTTGNVILWDTSVWSSAGPARRLLAHPGIPHLTPRRFLVWKPLTLRRTGTRVLIADVHAVNGYCSGRPQQALRQRLAHLYWATVMAWTWRHPNRVILLGGDFNCWLGRAHPFPRRVLLPGYGLDRAPWYDHLLTSRSAGAPKALRRWEIPAHSDHDINLRRLAFG